ncbi:16S rRNA (cytosine(967)-C(5))-methyltransferase RsmB [Intestinibacillus massiliensis]|uniref:16S rRNA (cytosine(967)-C(5))-methyltransferase RsmB n=1 Tax=Intestinibacillus massiliensis TaxID=1871029 RepID=UPI000B3591CA|nr:16S rRNA (cytosine(967)-C(5))-methyltransferase RsmB [Intestinibacillus massiliensis]
MIKKRPATAREVAAFSLFSMAEDGAWSDGALHQYLARAGLPGRDAALATRLCYGVLQNRAMCDFYLAKFSSVRLRKIAPRVLDCLRLGVYQLTMMERIPAHAAVGETVALIEKYAHASPRTVGYANGVLRAVARAAQEGGLPVLDCPDKERYYALRYSHPEWLVRALSAQFGQKEAGKICEANNRTAPLSLRVNTLRTTREDALRALADAGFEPRPHEAIADVILCAGGDIASLPLFRDGLVTVQDGAGAVCADILSPTPGALTVDCCAAPGGKSFALAARMQDTGRVVSCDIYEHKLDRIRAGAARLGLGCIEPRLADATRLQNGLAGQADFVLCDVPCSGMGIIRKKPEIRYKPEAELAGLPALQGAILENCAQYVRPGGTLVYSTCTVLERENAGVVEGFLAAHPGFSAVPFTHPACGERQDGMVTLLPHVHDTDGFFIAKLRRNA